MSFEAIFTGPVMAILRGFAPAETVRLAGVAWDLGITAVEVPIGCPEQVEALRHELAYFVSTSAHSDGSAE